MNRALLKKLIILMCSTGFVFLSSQTLDSFPEDIKFLWKQKSEKNQVDKMFSAWAKELDAAQAGKITYDDMLAQWTLTKESWTIDQAGLGAGKKHLKNSIDLFAAAGLYPSSTVIRSLAENNARKVCDALALAAVKNFKESQWGSINKKYEQIREISFNIYSADWYGYKEQADYILQAYREYEQFKESHSDFILNTSVFTAGVFFIYLSFSISFPDNVQQLLDAAAIDYQEYLNTTDPGYIVNLERQIKSYYARANVMEISQWASGALGLGLAFLGTTMYAEDRAESNKYIRSRLNPFFPE